MGPDVLAVLEVFVISCLVYIVDCCSLGVPGLKSEIWLLRYILLECCNGESCFVSALFLIHVYCANRIHHEDSSVGAREK